jgi:hypothetical protein
LLELQRLWHAPSYSATFTFATERRHKGGHSEQNKLLTSVVLQSLDSKDKIATLLQPAGRKLRHRQTMVTDRTRRSTFASTPAAPRLATKILAIMNFS